MSKEKVNNAGIYQWLWKCNNLGRRGREKDKEKKNENMKKQLVWTIGEIDSSEG